jgi:hypothetical protein
MCQNGQWRVTQGQCEGEDYYDPYNNRHEILVGSSAPPAPGSTQPVMVGTPAPTQTVVMAGAPAPTKP